MKQRIIFLTIAVVVLSGSWLIFRDRPEDIPNVSETPGLPVSPKPTVSKESTGGNFNIIINQDGVSNNNLTIRAGDKVTFINRDSVPHWPAAGAHPSHNLCPGFDAKRGLRPEESFSFTFDQAGICPFHDHLHARNDKFNGTITVSSGK